MATFNRVIVVGNLTRDPEYKIINNATGAGCTTFGIAVNEKIKKGDVWEDYANFFDVTVFGKTATACADHLSKGKPVLVEGRLRQRRWEKDGAKRSAVEIIADNVQFLGSKDASPANTTPANDDLAF